MAKLVQSVCFRASNGVTLTNSSGTGATPYGGPRRQLSVLYLILYTKSGSSRCESGAVHRLKIMSVLSRGLVGGGLSSQLQTRSVT